MLKDNTIAKRAMARFQEKIAAKQEEYNAEVKEIDEAVSLVRSTLKAEIAALPAKAQSEKDELADKLVDDIVGK